LDRQIEYPPCFKQSHQNPPVLFQSSAKADFSFVGSNALRNNEKPKISLLTNFTVSYLDGALFMSRSGRTCALPQEISSIKPLLSYEILG